MATIATSERQHVSVDGNTAFTKAVTDSTGD